MAVTSVTGTGIGASSGKQKGAQQFSIGAEKIIGPRIVYAVNGTLNGTGDLVIQLPVLPGVASNYVVLVSDADGAAANAVAGTLAISSSATTITVKGTANQNVSVVVLKAGLAA